MNVGDAGQAPATAPGSTTTTNGTDTEIYVAHETELISLLLTNVPPGSAGLLITSGTLRTPGWIRAVTISLDTIPTAPVQVFLSHDPRTPTTIVETINSQQLVSDASQPATSPPSLTMLTDSETFPVVNHALPTADSRVSFGLIHNEANPINAVALVAVDRQMGWSPGRRACCPPEMIW